MDDLNQTVLNIEELRSVAEIGDFFISLGQKLKDQGFFTLTQADRKADVRLVGTPRLELKYKIKKGNKHKFEIEIEWKPGLGGASDRVNVT